MKVCIITDQPNPITKKRCNEFNEQFSSEVVRNLNNSYDKVKNKEITKKNQQIVDCYNKAWLCYQLYSCLVEEDEERLRESVQRLADENLNEIVAALVELGYVF